MLSEVLVAGNSDAFIHGYVCHVPRCDNSGVAALMLGFIYKDSYDHTHIYTYASLYIPLYIPFVELIRSALTIVTSYTNYTIHSN